MGGGGGWELHTAPMALQAQAGLHTQLKGGQSSPLGLQALGRWQAWSVGATSPMGCMVPHCAACIRYGLFKVCKPAPRLLTCSLVKSDGMGGGMIVVGLEEVFWGYGPWLGGGWLYHMGLGGFLQKHGHAGVTLVV